MKRAKIVFTAFMVIAVAGGVLASKAKLSPVVYYTTSHGSECAFTTFPATTSGGDVLITSNVYATLDSNPTACEGVSNTTDVRSTAE